MKKLLFVYNPRSGKGLIRSNLSAIIEQFTANGYDVTVHPTQRELDAAETVERRAAEFDLIVCSGGDGTLDEVVTGLMNSGEQKKIGYIPAGSTNDFASSVDIPKSMEQAAVVITDGEPFACDLGKFNDSYFVYVAAFGMFTEVSYQTPQDMKNVLGHTAYLLEGMKRMGSWKSRHLSIESEEFSEEGEFAFGMITNSNSVGGFKGLPGKNIELNDGLFEVMLVRTPKNLIEWQDAITSILTQSKNSQTVVRFKTNHMIVRSEEPLPWTRDGEDGGEHTLAELTNLQQVLQIMTPSETEAVSNGTSLA